MKLLCTVCGHEDDRFDDLNGRSNARCPRCSCVERHRFLFLILEEQPACRHVLDVAPQVGPIRRRIVALADLYVGLDLAAARNVSVRGDLTRLPFPNDSFDLLVCYHVLEHIRDDRVAMAELARVLRPSGTALIQVPIRLGCQTDEDPDLPPDERARRFGQSNHLRFYGDDFDDRLRASGLTSERVYPSDLLSEDELGRFAIQDRPVWRCHANEAADAPHRSSRAPTVVSPAASRT